MKKYVVLLLWALPLASFAAKKPVVGGFSPQDEYEKSIEATVRHKIYYKAGHFEVTGLAGAMPYDSVVSHITFGGRATYHFADHYGWEIADVQLGLPKVSNYTTNLVASKGLSQIQVTKINLIAASNFLFSPFYGKIRVFGSSVVYFDTYIVAGLGMANTSTVQVGTTGLNVAASISQLRSGFEPMFDIGFGFKIYAGHALAVVVDFRDYVIDTQSYGAKSMKSNFSMMLGLSFFLPTF